ncbi:MAG: ubiquinol-cytochrome c reductase iron-sulfur subunit [Ignavibacteria bacterium]
MNITRKSFFKILFSFIIVVTSSLIIRFLKAIPFLKPSLKIRLLKDIPTGVTFYEDLISVKYNENLKIFSSKCSHLGCRINNFNGTNFKCFCHGSEFNIEGIPVLGPAKLPLKILKFEYFNNDKEVKVYLE